MLTDQDLLTVCQDAVLEAPDGGLTWPSGLWRRDEVIDYANRAQDEWLRATACILTRVVVPCDANVRRHDLPQDWILTQRVAWQDADGGVISLPRTDQFEIDQAAADEETTTAARPLYYFDGTVPLLQLQVTPGPSDAGQILLLYVSTGALLDGSGVAFTVPDEAVPYLQWRVLEQMLLKLGRMQDPSRASYCHARWMEGLSAMQALLRGWVTRG